ncbi:MAG TPA: Hint domain-containing protein [Pyrinomonadaceae bacterium]|nr:Hint domain-containing protein [Pyrinomonadaceae bacterium]
MVVGVKERDGVVTRGDLDALRRDLVRDIELGKIIPPRVEAARPNIAGGVNHCPNSDLSYSTLAATVAGTMPADVDDLNYEAYGFYWIERDADVVIDDEHALKSLDHSLYAAGEGADTGKPDWDRVFGWIEDGSTGDLCDIIIKLPANIVGPGQRWFVRMRLGALDAALIPEDVQVFAGIWHTTATGEGYVEGSDFDLSHSVEGVAGSTSIDYRVLAKTDSGVSILSNVLNVPDAPDAFSTSDYVKLFFNAGPGFIEYQIYKKVGSDYFHIYTVRNSSDLQYNDVGIVAFEDEVVTGWPSVTQAAPQAYAETKTVRIGAYQGEWKANDLTIDVPATYDFSETVEQYLRIGLTSQTGVDRHIGIDRIWFSTTYNEWSPDDASRYASGPSISPTFGSQGIGGGVTEPPKPGTGGGTCVVVKTPVLIKAAFKPFQSVKVGSEVKGDERLPYKVILKKQGVVSEYLVIRTRNGITIRCSVDHPLALELSPRKRIEARHVREGMRLMCWVKGRKTSTEVVSVELVPRPAEVGTFTLRHTGGLHRDGDGMYVAGESKNKDRGLFCFNLKSLYDES